MSTANLFQTAGLSETAPRPLADRLRPEALQEVVGQPHLVGEEGTLTRMLATGRVGSMVFWGPPGTGKTTVARLLANVTDLHFEQISAIFSGVADLKKVFEAARGRRETGQGTLLFVDEIHRFNRAQQDAFLPHVEAGTIILIGATTENPSFEVNSALLSRSRVLVLERLDEADVHEICERALRDGERGLGRFALDVDEAALDLLAHGADGDARGALAALEIAASIVGSGGRVTREVAAQALPRRFQRYDKSGEEHYNLISALHKSLRGSDPDAALYWLARMLDGG